MVGRSKRLSTRCPVARYKPRVSAEIDQSYGIDRVGAWRCRRGKTDRKSETGRDRQVGREPRRAIRQVDRNNASLSLIRCRRDDKRRHRRWTADRALSVARTFSSLSLSLLSAHALSRFSRCTTVARQWHRAWLHRDAPTRCKFAPPWTRCTDRSAAAANVYPGFRGGIRENKRRGGERRRVRFLETREREKSTLARKHRLTLRQNARIYSSSVAAYTCAYLPFGERSCRRKTVGIVRLRSFVPSPPPFSFSSRWLDVACVVSRESYPRLCLTGDALSRRWSVTPIFISYTRARATFIYECEKKNGIALPPPRRVGGARQNMSLSLIECSSFDGDVIVSGEEDKKGIITEGVPGVMKCDLFVKYTVIIVNISTLNLYLKRSARSNYA